MNMDDFKALLKKNNVILTVEPDESMTVSQLGLDSFDVMMLAYDLEEAAGCELKLTLDSTVGEVLSIVNHEQ
jgi:acyl carrier protein